MRAAGVLVAVALSQPAQAAPAQQPYILSTATTAVLAAVCRESKNPLGANFCTGYILAAYDRMSMSRQICPRDGITTEQVMAVGRQFLASHPELWDRHPSYVLELAFGAAFGCPAE
jgi:hypothetical protein